jgi:hypothetical protein
MGEHLYSPGKTSAIPSLKPKACEAASNDCGGRNPKKLDAHEKDVRVWGTRKTWFRACERVAKASAQVGINTGFRPANMLEVISKLGV